MPLERVSVEVTNRCAKACDFCYNHSLPGGGTRWTPDELVAFASDCAANGVKAVSFGGGEPLQYDGLFEVFERLRTWGGKREWTDEEGRTQPPQKEDDAT
jgi:MoaA/NifB/PqqE/SkfB family radical SAM enzyme